MSSALILRESPSLASARTRLATARTTLADREADLAQLRAQLKAFDSRYLRQVGVLYAQLDEIEAQIAEREVALYDSESARRRAREARARANETHEAAASADLEPEEFDTPPNLKTLSRELARRIHPDFARDDAEQKHFTTLMARANQAYTRGDAETLQRLLDDHREATTEGEGESAELARIERQIAHAERDIAALNEEQSVLESSEIGQLHQESQAATLEHRDLLTELAATLTQQLTEAQYRLSFTEKVIDRQT